MGYLKEGLGFHGDPQHCPKSLSYSPPYPQFCWHCSCCLEIGWVGRIWGCQMCES
ncbi:unnamed protein product, partial [Vitis vinifera]|uniref:Uncharacterized protein n=1 Tax=Vitis vinifera TaxID=29760 RepID=D7T3U3_VITVI